ncbi:uncharacterized protein [Heterodontus francisci]|uniref:uncharacterized protein n=1 Tax=Heterodontus francisci TaxID=7792 RepID=UPI00355B2403
MAEETVLPMMFLFLFLLMKRRAEFESVSIERRNDVQRRLRMRQYFQQRQRKMILMVMARGGSRCNCRTRIWCKPRSSDWWERVVMKDFQPNDWLENFRMSKETFFHICNKLKPMVSRRNTHLRPALPLEKRVAVAFWRLATNVEYRTISHLFGIGRSTVCKCVREVCHAIVSLLKPLYLRMPSNQEFETMAQTFGRKWDFPQCVGAIDSCHIPIIAPPQYHKDYLNKKGWHSVVLQGVVDDTGNFWDVCTGFSGSSLDTKILRNSDLWRMATEGRLFPDCSKNIVGTPVKYLLIGSSSYPLQEWLLKPYSETAKLSQHQLAFNYKLNQAHTVIHDAFGRLKARWQCLLKRNDCSLELIPTMITACCILHNICEKHNDGFNNDWLGVLGQEEFPQPNQIVSDRRVDRQAEEIRQVLSTYFMGLEQS